MPVAVAGQDRRGVKGRPFYRFRRLNEPCSPIGATVLSLFRAVKATEHG